MLYSIFSTKDTTIYQNKRYLNAGIDEILEISKVREGFSLFNTRILLHYDITEISKSVALGNIPGDAQFYLKLYADNFEQLSADYTLNVHPVSQAWDQGLGFYYKEPTTTIGASWVYRTESQPWATASFVAGTTGSWIGTFPPGGATWYTSSYGTETFDTYTRDVTIEVSDIVWEWISGSLPNNGFIIKRTDAEEKDDDSLERLQFFSKETHTIYSPLLMISYDDSSYSTGSLAPLVSENINLYIKNLQKEYKEGSLVKLRVYGRPKYPTRTFSTSSAYLDLKYLPETVYYSVRDSVTDEEIIPFHEVGTKLSCDEKGNFFNFKAIGLAKERYYRFVFKVERDDNIEYFDNSYFFKIVR